MDEAELLAKLRAADAAGDTAEATRIAKLLRGAAAPVDDGVSPAPVEEGHNRLVDKALDYGKSFLPEGDPWAGPAEWATGVAQGVTSLPNIVPNIGNTTRDLYDLHFGSGQGLKQEDMYKPWFDEPTYAEPRPGWEGTREAGQTTGSASPLALMGPEGLLAATVGVPIMTKMGRAGGALIDKLRGTEDTQKWARTGETLAPLLGGAVRAVKPAVSKIPFTKGAGIAAATGTVSPEAALAALGAKAGLQGMDKLVLGPRPGGFVNGFDKTLKETGVGLRQEDRRRNRGER